MTDRDIVVIGGGPAGYVAAIRGAQLGAKVTLVEEKKLGGVCLNRGCMPTKFMLHAAEIFHSSGHTEWYGVSASPALDMARLQAGKNELVAGLVNGVRGLLAAGKVEIIEGRARLAPGKQLITDSGDTFQAEKIIICTGARPVKLPIPGADAPDIMNYEDLLNLDRVPESLAIIGGGVVGVEMATVLSRLGSKVTIIEMMPQILPAQDKETVAILTAALKEDGIRVFAGARLEKIEADASGKKVIFSVGGETNSIEATAVAVTAGQWPNIEDLGLEECGVAVENGHIKTDERMGTSAPDIFAAGDVTGGIMLAHIAFAEGRVAAENAAGGEATMDYQVVPQCIYASPEMAGVGLTEEEARNKGHELKIGRFPFQASGMAAVLGETRGLVKIITEEQYGSILGIHIVGPGATALIAEATLAIKLELTPQEIIETIHAHPTLSEAFWEAALDVSGETIHFPSHKRPQR